MEPTLKMKTIKWLKQKHLDDFTQMYNLINFYKCRNPVLITKMLYT